MEANMGKNLTVGYVACETAAEALCSTVIAFARFAVCANVATVAVPFNEPVNPPVDIVDPVTVKLPVGMIILPYNV